MGKIWNTGIFGDIWNWDIWADAAETPGPTVTTQAVSGINPTQVTGNGTITATGYEETALHAAEVSHTGNPAVASQVFTAVDCTGLTKANGTLVIDIKCSDPSLITTGVIEVGSAGTFDTEEWEVTLPSGITTAYQTFEIDLSGATTTGGELVVSEVDWIRAIAGSSGGNITLYWQNAKIRINHATRRGFAYMAGASGDPTTADSVAYDDGSFATGAYTKAITGFSPGTAYRVRAYATNSAGTGYGETVSVTTATEEPTTRAVDMCLEVELDGGTERYSLYGLSDTYYWAGRILSFSPVRRSIPISGGLGTVGNCTFRLADADRKFRTTGFEDYIGRRVNLKMADAATGTLYQIMTGKIQNADFDEDSFSLRIRDDSYKKLKEYVSNRIVQDRTDWTNLPSTLKAVLVPVLQGIVTSSNYRKTGYMPAYLVDPAIGQSKYRYIACQGSVTISKVFRNGVEVDSGDWTTTQTNDPSATYAVTYIDFDREQREGSDLTKDTITWDGTGPNGVATPAEAVEEILKLAGWDSDDYDTASFTAANTLYDDTAKTITAGVSVTDKEETWEDFLEYCGRQFSAQFYYNTAGKLAINFESWEVPASDAYDYVLDDSIIQSITVDSVPESHTGLKVSYAYDAKEREESWARDYNDSDELTRQNSVADIGSFDIPFAYNAESADSLAYCHLKSISSERQIITIRTAAIAGLELGDYIKVISNFGSGSAGYEALLCRVLEIETAINGQGGVDNILRLVDHAGDAFPTISTTDSAGTDADVVEDSRDITTSVVFSSSAYNAISWAAGAIKMPSGQTFNISSGSSTGWANDATRYIYFDPDTSTTTLQVTTTYSVPAVRRGYLLATAERSDDSSSSSAPFNVRYGLANYSGSTFTGSIFQTSTSNPKVRIDPTDQFQLINAGGYKVIQMDTTDYFTLRTALGVKSISMTPANGLETFDSDGLLNVRIGEPAGTYIFFAKSSGSSHTNNGFALDQEANTVSALWWYGSTFAGKIYASSADVLTIEASDGSGAVQVVADYFESAIVNCDALRPKTNAASDTIKIYDVAGTQQVSAIYADNGSDDSGFAAGDGDTSIRGILWATAQTAGTDRAGVFILQNESGSNYYLWVDTTGNLRGHTADPGSNDTLGVIIADLSP